MFLKNRKLIFIFLVAFILFLPSFGQFFTNDDFFHLLIAKPGSIANFFSFFDITQNHQGYSHFRPLTTQMFYTLAWLTKLNPFPMHIILFINYIGVCLLVYGLLLMLGLKPGMAMTGLFLYTVSSTHFGRLYFLSTQEFGYAFFVLLSVISFVKFTVSDRKNYYWISLMLYILSLLAKETALVTPILIFSTALYLSILKNSKNNPDIFFKYLKPLAIKLIPFIILSGIYLYFRIFYYGLANGDSYVWDISLRVFNTIFWYGLWSFNLPEMLVDFIGPGININPNLLKFWSREIIPIAILFTVQILILMTVLIKKHAKIVKSIPLLIFSLFWFTASLFPVLFLPLHKFSFYTTVALAGMVSLIVCILQYAGNKIVIIFCTLWLLTSYLTLSLTEKTNWITRGAQTAKNINEYFQVKKYPANYTKIIFIDTPDDANLPWKPTEILKSSLSDENYFKVFYPGQYEVLYGNENISVNAAIIEARQFIGY